MDEEIEIGEWCEYVDDDLQDDPGSMSDECGGGEIDFECDDDVDPMVAYKMGYDSDDFDLCPFEGGTELSDEWHSGRDASEIDDLQRGSLPTRYRTF